MYINKQKFNDGLSIQGQVPVDDRLYLDSLQDLMITLASASSSKLYSRAYKGMTVVIGDTNDILICTNADPYTPGKLTSQNPVSMTTYLTYWKDVTDKTKMVDGDSIKVISDKLTGTLYRMEKLNVSTGSGLYSSYALSVKTPGASAYTLMTPHIDIPELQVVNDVHVCKAVYNESKHTYTETARQGDPNWDTAPGDVYLHIIWYTKDDDSDPTDDKSKETYIKVSDMISVDVTGLQDQITDLSTRTKSNVDKINSSINSINSSIRSIKFDVSTLDKTLTNSIAQNVSTLTVKIDDASSREQQHYTSITGTVDDLSTRTAQKFVDTSTFFANRVNDVSSYVNTRIDSINSSLTRYVTDVSTRFAAEESSLNAHMDRLDSSYRWMDASFVRIDSSFRDLDSSVKEAIAYSSSIFDDVSTQELIMAAAVIRIDTSIKYIQERMGTMTYGSGSTIDSMMQTMGAAKGTEDYNYVAEDVDMGALFDAEIGADAPVDLRTVNSVGRYIIKNGVKVEIEQTFNDSTDSIVFYYDFLDGAAFKREFVEIGMNEESSLVVVNKKTVKICKV